jgi:hypothetical protein
MDRGCGRACHARRPCRRRGQHLWLGRVRLYSDARKANLPAGAALSPARLGSAIERGRRGAASSGVLSVGTRGALFLLVGREIARTRAGPSGGQRPRRRVAAEPGQAVSFRDVRGAQRPGAFGAGANQIPALVGSARALGREVELFTKRQAKRGVLSLKRYPGAILNA